MPFATRLLVVEGDAMLRDLLVEQLSPCADFEVVACQTGSLGREALQQDVFDHCLFDLSLPDMEGRDFVAAIREDGFRGPAIMLVPPQADVDTATGQEVGPELLVKPFRIAALIARIRAQLRAYEASEEAAFPIGPYEFRPGAKALLSADGSRLKLTEKEAAILRFLHRAGSSTVGRDVLLQEVFGYNAGVTTHTLETHIYRLRQKIELDPSAARILVTEPGGYRLMEEPA